MRRLNMVLLSATGATTLIIPTDALPTATTDQAGLAAASSSVRVHGMDGAGVMDGADTAIAAATDTAVDTDIVAAMVVDTAALTVVADTEAESAPLAASMAVTTPMQAADMAVAMFPAAAEPEASVVVERVALAVVADSMGAAVAASTVVAADIAKT